MPEVISAAAQKHRWTNQTLKGVRAFCVLNTPGSGSAVPVAERSADDRDLLPHVVRGARVGEELRLLGCLVLITLFGLFMWRGLIIAERADSPLGTYLGIGIVWMVVAQAVINMSVLEISPHIERAPP